MPHNYSTYGYIQKRGGGGNQELLHRGSQQRQTEVRVDRTQRQRCHHRCLIAAVSDKIHKAWPLASLKINKSNCFKFVSPRFARVYCHVFFPPKLLTILSSDIPETASGFNTSTRTSTVHSQLKLNRPVLKHARV